MWGTIWTVLARWILSNVAVLICMMVWSGIRARSTLSRAKAGDAPLFAKVAIGLSYGMWLYFMCSTMAMMFIVVNILRPFLSAQKKEDMYVSGGGDQGGDGVEVVLPVTMGSVYW